MITIYGKPNCGYCNMAKALCEQKGAEYSYLSLGDDYDADEFAEKFPTARTFPQIVVDDQAVGGYNELRDYFDNV